MGALRASMRCGPVFYDRGWGGRATGVCHEGEDASSVYQSSVVMWCVRAQHASAHAAELLAARSESWRKLRCEIAGLKLPVYEAFSYCGATIVCGLTLLVHEALWY